MKGDQNPEKYVANIIYVWSLEQFCQGDAVLGQVLDQPPHAAGEARVQGAQGARHLLGQGDPPPQGKLVT